MVLSTWADFLNQSFQTLVAGLIVFIPNLIVAIVIFIIGWLIGVGLERVIKQIVDALRVDSALKAAGVDRVVERAGFSLSSGLFLGVLVKWFVIAVFLIAALDVLHLNAVNSFLSEVVLNYLPLLIGAVLILLIGAVVADVAQRVVAGAARAGRLQGANFLGSITRYAIWVFAILAALDRLGISPLIQTIVTGIVMAISIALGLAFGLGGQAAAARYIEHLRGSIKD